MFRKKQVLDGLNVRPISFEEKKLWLELMTKHHYLGNAQLAGESIRYVATLDDKWVALMGWSWPALKCRWREKWIDWSEDIKTKRLRFIVNNTRFLILPWVKIKHLASKTLALNIKRLSPDWEAIYNHPVLVAETFVDESRFKGTCYKAAGWLCLGKTRGFARHRKGYISHGKQKMIFVCELRKNAKKILRASYTHPMLTEKGAVSFMIDVNKLPLEGKGGLIDFLETINDPRSRYGIRYKFKPLLAVIICACLSGARSYIAIAEWVQTLSKEALLQLGFRWGKPPSETALRRFIQKLNAEEVDKKICSWFLNLEQSLSGRAIAIDGKTLRGAFDGDKKAPHLISAILHKEGVVVAQRNVDKKTNEIPTARELINDIPIEGSIITADAMHTQTKTATSIVRDKKADYVFTVKDNQPTLRQEIKSFNLEAFPPSED